MSIRTPYGEIGALARVLSLQCGREGGRLSLDCTYILDFSGGEQRHRLHFFRSPVSVGGGGKTMKIEYFGHSCVRLTAADGTRILIDPFDGIGYPMPRVRADIVLCTHGHFDHHYTEGVEGAREVIEAVGSYDRGGVHIEGIASCHDDRGGSKRGKNVIFVVDDGQARVCHMGDIGELPRADLLRAIGQVDLLFVPVGGTYTVDAEGALAYIDAARPRTAMAIHYCCPGCTLDIAPVERFCALAGSRCVRLNVSAFDTGSLARYAGKILVAERGSDAGE